MSSLTITNVKKLFSLWTYANVLDIKNISKKENKEGDYFEIFVPIKFEADLMINLYEIESAKDLFEKAWPSDQRDVFGIVMHKRKACLYWTR